MAKKITQAICQLNINSFRQLQIYSAPPPLCFIWQSCCAHTHFSYCVFHKFLFALCNRRLTTKSHKCFRLSTKADMKASVIPMKRCICLSVCVYVCVCVFACRLSMSVGLLKIYFKYIEIAFGLAECAILAQNSALYGSCKNYCILLGCAIKQSPSLGFSPFHSLSCSLSLLVMKAFRLTKCALHFYARTVDTNLKL